MAADPVTTHMERAMRRMSPLTEKEETMFPNTEPETEPGDETKPAEVISAHMHWLDPYPDGELPELHDALREWLEARARTSPACRRHHAEGLAQDIAAMPGNYRHWIGAADEILGVDGEPTGYRMGDFIPEAQLGTYRTFAYGSPEATEPLDEMPPQVDTCDGDPTHCMGGHWDRQGLWHFTPAAPGVGRSRQKGGDDVPDHRT